METLIRPKCFGFKARTFEVEPLARDTALPNNAYLDSSVKGDFQSVEVRSRVRSVL